MVACACFTKVTSAFLCPKMPLQTSGHKSFGLATHKQKRTFSMVHSHAPRVGSGITCDHEGKGWEGVESRVPGNHVRVWLLRVATCLWSSGLRGGWAVYIHLVPSIVRSRHEWRLFSQLCEQRRPMGGGDSGFFQWLFPVKKVTKGGIPFSNSGGLPFLHVTRIKSYLVLSSNEVLFSVLAGKKHALTCHSSKWGHKRTKGHKQEKMGHKSKSSKKDIPRKIQKKQKNE